MQRYLDKLSVLFDRWADEKIPFSYVILTFLAATLLRTFGEHIVLASVLPGFWGEDLAHYTLSYIALALTIILFLHVVTGDAVGRAARIVLPGFIILNLVPLIDGLIGAGGVYRIGYLLPETEKNLPLCFLTFFGPLKEWGVTPGMRLEIALVMALVGLYIFSRTRRFLRAALGVVLFYTIVFLYVAMPFWVQGTMAFMGFSQEADSWLFIRWYFALIVPLGAAALYFARPEVFRAVVRDMRWMRLLHYLLFMFIGAAAFIRYWVFPVSMDRDVFFRAFFLVISVVAAWLFSVITNNEADRDIDRISNPHRPTVTGVIPLELYRWIRWGSFGCAGFFAFMAGMRVFEIVLVFMANYFLYSMPPLRLKRVPVLSKLVIGANSLLAFMLGYGLFVEQTQLPSMFFVFFLIFMAAAANFIDLKDRDGDAAAGIKTLPVLVGLSLSKKLIGAAFILTYWAAYAVFNLTGCFLVCFGAGVLQYVLINRKDYDERPVLWVHLLSLVFILSYTILIPR